MLARAPEPKVQAQATALPFPDASFGSVALLYVLYTFPTQPKPFKKHTACRDPKGSSPSRPRAAMTPPNSLTSFPELR